MKRCAAFVVFALITGAVARSGGVAIAGMQIGGG